MSASATRTLTLPTVRGWAWGWAIRAVFIYALLMVGDWSGIWHIPNLEVVSMGFQKVIRGAYDWIDIKLGHTTPGAPWQIKDSFYRWWLLYGYLFPTLLGGLWLLLDRRRKHDRALHEAARVLCRYTLAGMLLFYGGEKLLGYQGGWAMSPDELIIPSGNLSGFSAMMAWLCHSSIYAWFSGWAEAGAGLLMFTRRYTSLAAVLCIADMAMVGLINTSYWDHLGTASLAPLHFIPMAAFLLAPHARRFANFFLGKRPPAGAFEQINPPSWLYRLGVATKVMIIPVTFYVQLLTNGSVALAITVKSPLYGVYQVEEYQRDGTMIPASPEHPERWRIVGIDRRASSIAIRLQNDSTSGFSVQYPKGPETSPFTLSLVAERHADQFTTNLTAPPTGNLALSSTNGLNGPDLKFLLDTLRYTRVGDNEVVFDGPFRGGTLRVKLRRIILDSLPFFRYRWKPI